MGRGRGFGHTSPFAIGNRSGFNRYGGGTSGRFGPPPPVPNAVAALTLQGEGSLCGLPCAGMHGGAVTAPIDLPPSAADLYTAEEWSALARQVSQLCDDTHTPLCPCVFTLCGFICCTAFNEKSRRQGLADIVQQENARMHPQGLQWVQVRYRGPSVMVLTWLPSRLAWEAANPHRRAVSREQPLAEFTAPAAAAILSMGPAPAQQQMQMQIVAQGPPQQQQVIMVGQPQPVVVMQGPPQPMYVQQQPQQQMMGQPQYVQQPQYAQNGQPQYAPQGGQPQYVQQNGQPQYGQGPPQYSQQPYSPQPQIHSPSGPQFGADGQPVYS
jgi:hypothetical protein